MNKDILKNLNKVKFNILNLCKKINRNPKEINIVAVSKKQPPDKIIALIDSGHHCFGENRLEETREKWPNINNKNINLHYIGALQSKKVKDIINNFKVIETLDSESSAKKISTFINQSNKAPPKIFIQVNIGQEKQKRGINVLEVESFLRMCNEKYKLSVIGAMCMPPNNNNTEKFFKAFKQLCFKNKLKEIYKTPVF